MEPAKLVRALTTAARIVAALRAYAAIMHAKLLYAVVTHNAVMGTAALRIPAKMLGSAMLSALTLR